MNLPVKHVSVSRGRTIVATMKAMTNQYPQGERVKSDPIHLSLFFMT